MLLFEKLKLRNMPIDAVAYMGIVRSAGFCRPWKQTIEILEQAHDELPNPLEVIDIVHTAMTNEKYRVVPQSAYAMNSGLVDAMERVQFLMQWLQEKKIPVQSKTIVSTRSSTCYNI